jgi:hypothetical protein
MMGNRGAVLLILLIQPQLIQSQRVLGHRRTTLNMGGWTMTMTSKRQPAANNPLLALGICTALSRQTTRKQKGMNNNIPAEVRMVADSL